MFWRGRSHSHVDSGCQFVLRFSAVGAKPKYLGLVKKRPRGNNGATDAEEEEEEEEEQPDAAVRFYPHCLSQLRTHARSHARTNETKRFPG